MNRVSWYGATPASQMVRRERERIDLYSFCLRTTYHGLLDIYQAKGVIPKLFWSTLVLAATIATVSGCYSILHQYCKSPLLVSYIMRTSLERQLPDIAICPFAQYDAKFMAGDPHGASTVAENVKHAYKTAFRHGYDAQKPEFYQSNMQMRSLMASHDWSFSETMRQDAADCSSLIRYCYTPSRKGFYNCCEQASPVYSGYGKCFRIRGEMQLTSGYDFGIAVVVRVPNSSRDTTAMGISVRLAERDRGFGNDLSFIPAGVHALMPLRSVLYNFVNMPPRYRCVEEEEENYVPEQCIDQCVFDLPQRYCNCSHLTSTQHRLAACTPYQLYSCLYKQVELLRNTTVFRACRQKCRPPCTYWEYYPTVSYAYFPGEAHIDYHGLADMRGHVVLNVFYERLEYPVVKHVPAMSVPQFVANLGGQLGLWVGGSVLTLAQMLIFLGQYSWRALQGKRDKQRKLDEFQANSHTMVPPVYV